MSRPIKRSLSIRGHRTSISLEPEFWDALREVASARGQTIAGLVATIDEERSRSEAGSGPAPGRNFGGGLDSGLSSALRVHVLRHYQGLVGGSAAITGRSGP